MFKIISLILVVSLTLFMVSCGTGDSAEQQSNLEPAKEVTKTPTYVTMPENTPLTVTLVDSIDTDVQVTGAEFRARISRPVVVDGHTLFAEGAEAKGTLTKVVQSGHLKTPAELNFRLTAIQNPSGSWVDVGTNTILEKKDSHTNREVAMIGGGAVVGGIIGKVINRDGSTEIGAAAGAAAGTGLAAATGKHDIFHAVGTEIVFYSSQSTQIALK
ncbi:MAG: hypothetical protein ABIJ61_04700 [bacterium]